MAAASDIDFTFLDSLTLRGNKIRQTRWKHEVKQMMKRWNIHHVDELLPSLLKPRRNEDGSHATIDDGPASPSHPSQWTFEFMQALNK